MRHSFIKPLWLALPVMGVALQLAAVAGAGEPTHKIRQTTDKVLAVVQDPELEGKQHAAERHERIRRIVGERFDWTAMSRRALGRHWRGKTEKQQTDFIKLFGDLLEKRYMDKIDNYSGQKVRYEDEHVDDDYARVSVAIITDENKEINVEYRMQKQDEQWRVYDIVIEGVSLVNNYRAQFNSILARSSFDDLLTKLRDKKK